MRLPTITTAIIWAAVVATFASAQVSLPTTPNANLTIFVDGNSPMSSFQPEWKAGQNATDIQWSAEQGGGSRTCGLFANGRGGYLHCSWDFTFPFVNASLMGHVEGDASLGVLFADERGSLVYRDADPKGYGPGVLFSYAPSAIFTNETETTIGVDIPHNQVIDFVGGRKAIAGSRITIEGVQVTTSIWTETGSIAHTETIPAVHSDGTLNPLFNATGNCTVANGTLWMGIGQSAFYDGPRTEVTFKVPHNTTFYSLTGIIGPGNSRIEVITGHVKYQPDDGIPFRNSVYQFSDLYHPVQETTLLAMNILNPTIEYIIRVTSGYYEVNGFVGFKSITFYNYYVDPSKHVFPTYEPSTSTGNVATSTPSPTSAAARLGSPVLHPMFAVPCAILLAAVV